MDFIRFLIAHRQELQVLCLQHLMLVAIGTGAATLVGVPVGIILTRRPRLSKPVLALANVLQTIPSLALFGFLIPLLGSHGIGWLPAVIALFLYSLLPIIRNTFTGINGVDPGVREAARGMGMTDWQILTRVELPLALNVIIAGIRVAAVISVGTATIAAAIGAGGLGTYIFRGLRSNDDHFTLAGAIPAAAMALLADLLLGMFEKALSPESAASSRRFKAVALAVAIGVGGLAIVYARGQDAGPARSDKIVVGSKDFTEQVILGELVAQVIESRASIPVERKFELAGDLCHRAMLSGEIDAYVEYTGTAYLTILKHEPLTDPREVYNRVQQEYKQKFDIDWSQPLGFEDTFAILIRGGDARRLDLKTISSAAKYAPGWKAGFGQDFMSREDGYRGFARAYSLKFAQNPTEMDLSLTYRALAAGQVDLIAGNSTDGLIEKLDLLQLEDDRHYFPPYEAAAVVRGPILARFPEVAAAIDLLAGKVTSTDMRKLNFAVDGDHRDAKEVVREFLAERLGPGK